MHSVRLWTDVSDMTDGVGLALASATLAGVLTWGANVLSNITNSRNIDVAGARSLNEMLNTQIASQQAQIEALHERIETLDRLVASLEQCDCDRCRGLRMSAWSDITR